MSDAELRLAERAHAAEPTAATLESLERVLVRHGLPLLCAECHQLPRLAPDPLHPDEPWCRPCLESALEHGHHHVGHEDPEPWLLDLCRLCRVAQQLHEESLPLLCCVTGCASPADLPLGVCREHAWPS